ncbi:hypothetical protein F4859DRAFT_394965 [Xylaria cf. heliscus]|nr:hypothetical protein F4859DRAFT_394965 [Xylaria cf. heliscus]
MSSVQLREAPAYARIASKVNATANREHLDGELRGASITDAEETLHIIGNINQITYSSYHKPEGRLNQAAKRRSRMKGAASLLFKPFTGLRGAFLDHVSPARNGKTFYEDNQQRRAIADMVHSDSDPWHEYEQLESDGEDDYPNPPSPKKKAVGTKLDAWFDRLTTAVEDSFAAQALFISTLQ